MSPAATILLLLVFLSGECFAGYSTGFRRTPKPKTPQVGRPVVFPSGHTGKEHPHWKDDSVGGVDGGIGNTDGGGVGKIGGDGDGSHKEETHQLDETAKEKTTGIGSHDGSGIWVPSPAVSPTDEKKETHNLPELPHKEGTSVELDDKTVKDYEVPDYPGEVPPSNQDQGEFEPHGEGEIVDLPGNLPQPHPDVPKHQEDGEVPIVPGGDSHEALPDKPLEEDTSDVGPDGGVFVPGEFPQPHPDIPKDQEGEVPIVPGGDSHEVFPDKPLEEDKSDVGQDGGVFEPEKVPQPHPDIPKRQEDEEVPIVPGGDSHEVFPGRPDGGVSVPEELPEQYPDEKLPPVIEEEGAVGIGPLPYPDVPRRDVVVVPPGVKTEVVEPYPMKVANGNINLYELMEKLELSRFLHLVEEANLKDLLTAEGPLTIFAPSDYALSKLDATTIRTLATNQELLRQFVLYHLVDGQISGSSFDERDNSAAVTKNDKAIHINRYGSVWFVNGIPITTRDQICRNGVIHILDNSLYPFPTGDLLETLEKLDNFKIYTELIRNAKLDKVLKGNEVYTIFVPTDAAFSKLPPANLEWLKWDIPAIKRMFRQLTVNGMYYTTWIPSGNGQLTSIDEKTQLSLSGYPDSINVNGVPLSQYDITANNGCIQVIDDIWFLSELGTPSGPSKKKD